MNQPQIAHPRRRVLHVTDHHSPGHPGVTAVVTQICRYLGRQGWPVTILAAGQAETPAPPGVDLVEFPLLGGDNPWRYCPGLPEYLEQRATGSGAVVHLHGVWGAPQWQAARAVARLGMPVLLSPHDMLSPWHWRDGRLRHLKKLVYWRLLAYPAFRRLRLVHAITPQERDHLAPQFPGMPLAVIPNAIDLQEADACLATASDQPPPEAPYLLFLSRLHPKKGIDLLITAFARAANRGDVRLLIVGPDWSPAYTAHLRNLARSLGLAGRVEFPGPVFGPGKWQLYRQAWAFCLPSRSEVVGLVNLEAAAARLPVITTYETGLWDWEEGGGVLVRPEVAELTRALKTALSWTESERLSRGQALRDLVARRYSWEAVGPQWLELYGEL